MKLDYNPANGLFILEVPPGTDRRALMTEYGLDWSVSTGLMSTPEPYCAATFAEHATPAARDKLDWIVREVDASRATSSNRHFDVPDGLELWDFQKADIEYMLRRDHSLDADEPGLGKTPTAIVFANEIQAKRVLVVCPGSIRFQWLRAIQGNPMTGAPGWSTMGQTYKVPDYTCYAIVSSKLGVHDSAAWTIVSYDLLRNPGIHAALMKGSYDLIILDEAHYLKTVGAKRTRAVFGGGHDATYTEPLAARARRIVGLTGTPLPNRPREAYVLARNLCHDSIDFASEDRFGERFNPVELIEVERVNEAGQRYTIRVAREESGRHAELQNRLRANFMTRHLKREVRKQLKPPVYDLIMADETAPVRQALKAEKLLDIDPETLKGADADVLGHIAEARRMMGEALAPQVAEYARMLLEGGVEKLVIFYWHISVGNILQQKLGSYGLVRVDGGITPTVKDGLVQRFCTDARTRVIIGNVLSLGTGTDGLQLVTGNVIIGEADWTPGNNIQCIDRLDRGGQTRTVQADIVVAPGSIAERVLASALRKLRVTTNALDRRL